MTQRRIRKAKRSTEKPEIEKPETTKDRGNDTVGITDAILDEIDEVLEVNAEQFIKQYVQKGGQ